MKSSVRRGLVPLFSLGALLAAIVVQVEGARPAMGSASMIPARDVPAALGANLPQVAANYGRTPEEFRDMLQEDHDLYMNRRGQLVYACATLANAAGKENAGAPPSGVPPYPVADTFKLHSRPSATKKIYLDFNGHTTSNTPWNTDLGGADIVSTPFDMDGNPAVFGVVEHEVIQETWGRVADDFAPFDVDVTTEDPGVEGLRRISGGDQNFGVRVVISPTDAWFPGAGGVAFLGYFDNIVSGPDVPCFAFSENVGNPLSGLTLVTSHEVGHTVGLRHDGTSTEEYYDGGGPGDWGPIMGAPYGKNIVHWSKGEYADANNKEDDYAVVQGNSLLFRPDDHGNTTATATTIPSATLNATGVIQGVNDKDLFRFATNAASINVDLLSPVNISSANVDIRVELLNASGGLIQGFDGTSLPAKVNLPLGAGIYYLSVEGTGFGDPLNGGYTKYGSLGGYRIVGTVAGGIGVKLNSPNGGQSFQVGSTQPINWQSSFLTSNVRLDYSTDGTTWIPISASTSNDGSENWTIPNNPTTTARVRVASLDGLVSDVSDNVFTITTAVGDAFEVDDSPAQARTLAAGEVQTHTLHVPGDEDWVKFTLVERSNVTLTTDGASGDTVLELYGPDDPSAFVAEDDNSGNGDFSQIARSGGTALPVGTYYARARAKSAAATISGAGYTLTLATSPGGSATLTAPNGGQNFAGGSQQVVTWTSFGITGNVKLEWFDGATWWVITDNTENDGLHVWTVPTVTTTEARVRVTPISDPVAQDQSDSAFTIFTPPAPTITVTYPGGGESLPRGSEEQIEWDSSNVAGNVRIEYSLDGGATWTVLALSSANDGVEDWTVPNTPSLQALVRISAVDGTAQDQSDNFFFIPPPPGDVYENDDVAQNASGIANGETQGRSIHLAGNQDWVRIQLTQKRRIVLTTSGAAGGDTVLTLYRADGKTVVATNDNYTSNSAYSRITSKAQAPGTYFARVTAKGSSTISSYNLNLLLKK